MTVVAMAVTMPLLRMAAPAIMAGSIANDKCGGTLEWRIFVVPAFREGGFS